MGSRTRKFVALSVSSLLLMSMAAACASASASSNGNTINVTETSYKFALSPSTAPAGTVTFHVVNQAADVDHDFVVIQTDTPAAQLPIASSGLVDEAKAGKVLGSVKGVPSGGSKDLTLNLTAGHYALICDLPGHYQLGMYADFTVK
jgi:uncharacterized cupredoxin-like copper-binding protein